LDSEDILLEKAGGRFLAKDIESKTDIPFFNNSAMDGFALDFKSTLKASYNNPVKFKVIGSISAGSGKEEIDKVTAEFYKPDRTEDIAVKISTGAPLPPCFNTVLKVEDSTVECQETSSDQYLVISKPLEKMRNIRLKGEDIKKGSVVAKRGSYISPCKQGLISSLGITTIPVFKKPLCIIISTGSELMLPNLKEEPLPLGKIYSSSHIFLIEALRSISTAVKWKGVVADSQEELRKTVEAALQEAPSVIITTGGVSMGERDYIPKVLKEVGFKIVFHKVAIRPGKPVLLAVFDKKISGKTNTVFFGLPGNPLSTIVGWRFFVLPYLLSLFKSKENLLPKAYNYSLFKKPKELTYFALASYLPEKNRVKIIEKQRSFMLSPFIESTYWCILPVGKDVIMADEELALLPFSPIL
ncbi:MAG: molybdopterin molybdenumtransferase MoeA, partial [Candidatus Dadabacteria bacterium]